MIRMGHVMRLSLWHLRTETIEAGLRIPASAGGRRREEGQTVTTPTVLLVDDAPEVRLVMRLLLDSVAEVVGEAGNGDEALAAYDASAPPDVVILDLRIPGMDGLAVAEAVLEQAPGQPILLWSSAITNEVRFRATAIGIRSCVNKEDFAELLRLIVAIAADAGSGQHGNGLSHPHRR